MLICFSIASFWVSVSPGGVWFTSTANPYASEYILFTHLLPPQKITFIQKLDQNHRISEFVAQILTELNPSHESDRESIDAIFQMILSFASPYPAQRPTGDLDIESARGNFDFTKHRFKFSRYDILLRLAEELLFAPQPGAGLIKMQVLEQQLLSYLKSEADFKSYVLARRISPNDTDLPPLASQILSFTDGDLKWFLAQIAIDRDRPELVCLIFVERIQNRSTESALIAAIQRIQIVSSSKTTRSSIGVLLEPAVDKYIFSKSASPTIQQVFGRSLSHYLEALGTVESYTFLRKIQRSVFWKGGSIETRALFKASADRLVSDRPEFSMSVAERVGMNCAIVLRAVENLGFINSK